MAEEAAEGVVDSECLDSSLESRERGVIFHAPEPVIISGRLRRIAVVGNGT